MELTERTLRSNLLLVKELGVLRHLDHVANLTDEPEPFLKGVLVLLRWP